jgi:hypothetical protein
VFGGTYLDTVYERTGQKTRDYRTEEDRDRKGQVTQDRTQQREEKTEKSVQGQEDKGKDWTKADRAGQERTV